MAGLALPLLSRVRVNPKLLYLRRDALQVASRLQLGLRDNKNRKKKKQRRRDLKKKKTKEYKIVGSRKEQEVRTYCVILRIRNIPL